MSSLNAFRSCGQEPGRWAVHTDNVRQGAVVGLIGEDDEKHKTG